MTKPLNLKEIYNRLKINETKVLEKKEFERLQKLHQQYEYAVNKKMLVSKTDLNGDIVFVNDKFCKLSGYAKEELLGQKHSIVRSGKTPPKIFQRMWKQIQQGKSFHGIITNKNKYGTEYVLDTIVIPSLDNNGNIVEYIGLGTDITSYVKKQDTKLSIVQDKTIMLFTHELKSPLNAIIAFATHMSKNIKKITDSSIRSKLLEYSHIIESNSQSLLSIINTMLDIAKLNANKLVFQKESFDIVKLIHQKVKIYTILYKREIVLQLPQKCDVLLDHKSVNHIVENLLSNALKYSNAKVFIDLSIQNIDGFDRVVFQIDDDGDGIKPQNYESVFKMFVQESQGRSLKEKTGTGVGLYLVKLLCDNNQFSVTIDKSTILGGASFQVIMPL